MKERTNDCNTEKRVKHKKHVAIKKYWRKILEMKNVAFEIM